MKQAVNPGEDTGEGRLTICVGPPPLPTTNPCKTQPRRSMNLHLSMGSREQLIVASEEQQLRLATSGSRALPRICGLWDLR